MSYTEIYQDIRTLIFKKLKSFKDSASYTANFQDDFGLERWEVNLLLYNVEDHFNLRLKAGLENEVDTINQLVAVVHREKQRQKEALKAA